MVKKTTLLTLAFLALILTASNGLAQNLAYIKSQEIINNFKEAQDAQEALDKLNQEWEAEGREMQQKLQELGQQLESQSLLLSEERKQEKQQELQNLYLQIQQFQQEKWGDNGEYFKKEAELMQPIIDKVNQAIAAIGEERDYDYIFDATGANIVYASPDQEDLTQDVLDELEKGLETQN